MPRPWSSRRSGTRSAKATGGTWSRYGRSRPSWRSETVWLPAGRLAKLGASPLTRPKLARSRHRGRRSLAVGSWPLKTATPNRNPRRTRSDDGGGRGSPSQQGRATGAQHSAAPAKCHGTSRADEPRMAIAPASRPRPVRPDSRLASRRPIDRAQTGQAVAPLLERERLEQVPDPEFGMLGPAPLERSVRERLGDRGADPRPSVHPWPMDAIPDPEVPEPATGTRSSAGRSTRSFARKGPG